MKKLFLLFALFGAIAQSCEEPEDPNAEVNDLLEKQDFKISQYLDGNNIAAEKDNLGIYRVALEENPEGEAIEVGDVALVDYKITQLDGTLIGEGEDLRLVYDSRATVVPAVLHFGLAYIQEGEKYRFYVPFKYAFGNYELDTLIPYRTIIVIEMEVEEVYQTAEELFEAELAVIDSAIADGSQPATDTLFSGIRKVLLEEGEGEAVDLKDVASVRYSGYFLNGEKFDSNTQPGKELYELIVGAGGSIAGFEAAVKSMREGEKAKFYIPSELAYGSTGWFIAPDTVREDLLNDEAYRSYWRSISRIPPFSPLVFEIELVELVKK